MNNPSEACPKPWQAIPADNLHNPEPPDLEMGPGPPLEQGQICPWTLRMVLVAVGYVVPPAWGLGLAAWVDPLTGRPLWALGLQPPVRLRPLWLMARDERHLILPRTELLWAEEPKSIETSFVKITTLTRTPTSGSGAIQRSGSGLSENRSNRTAKTTTSYGADGSRITTTTSSYSYDASKAGASQQSSNRNW
jgi:hypothetical protein